MREIDRVLARLPFAPIVGAMFALVAVVLVVASPQWLFERWVVLSGVADVVSAATPPLGENARFIAAITAGLVTGTVVWLVITIGAKLAYRAPGVDDSAPEIAPFFRPLSAESELGAPLMSDEAMAQARDELILEVPLAEDVADAVAPEAAPDTLPRNAESEDFAMGLAEVAETAGPVPEIYEAIQRTPVRLRPTEAETIPALLDRLEAAISRKPSGYRPDRADVTRLRRALGR